MDCGFDKGDRQKKLSPTLNPNLERVAKLKKDRISLFTFERIENILICVRAMSYPLERPTRQ